MAHSPEQAVVARRSAPDDGAGESKAVVPLAFAAVGIVFGDIGTSPLYALQTVFSIEHNTVKPNPLDVYGVISLMFWSVMFVVSLKYVLLVMRADNDGEGGILALVALLRGKLHRRAKVMKAVTLMGIIGAALFYGDSVITPAVSVLSAMEGLELVTPAAETLILPASVAILTVLFFVQRFGTGKVGRAFGPVMLVWFAVLAVLGIPQIMAHPQILAAVSPHYAALFVIERPWVAFVALGAIVLCITGAEALYADMGHFGRQPIRLAWFALVLPCLLINYFGQGAMILNDPSAAANPFFSMAPVWARLPLIVLATAATVIASQAVISGAFSVSRQASRLRLLPRLKVKQTSREEGGQIYIGAINWIIFVGVVTLVLVFQSSVRLATAYGLAVTGTLLLTLTLFLMAARTLWRWSWWKLILVGGFIGLGESMFFAANLTKVVNGGWIPLVISIVLIVIMTTWEQGDKARTTARGVMEGPLTDFVEKVKRPGIVRTPGVAVFPHSHRGTVPLALRGNFEFNRVLHERTVIVQVINKNVPHIRHVERIVVDDLGDDSDGIVHVSYKVGFNDSQNIPKVLREARGLSKELDFDPRQAIYFVSTLRVAPGRSGVLPQWRWLIFRWLTLFEAPRAAEFHLPQARVAMLGAAVEL